MILTFNSLTCMVMTYSLQKIEVGQSVQKIEWKQTVRQTDGRTDEGDCITGLDNAVDKYFIVDSQFILMLLYDFLDRIII